MMRRPMICLAILTGAVLAACSDDDDDPVCGDGRAEGAEVCDGADLRGATCAGAGFEGGTLACTASCALDTTGCTAPPACGNGVVEGAEACDGADLGGKSCAGLGQGFTGGELACTAACALDTAGCTASSTCGNGAIDGDEACDGTDLGGETCVSLGLGYLSGEVTCLASCNGFDLTNCSTVDPLCGNGELDGSELCDGLELQGQTCEALGLGFTGGALACRAGCQGWDVAGCTGLQTATPLPDGCPSPSTVGPLAGEESHLVAVRIEPAAYPFTVTAVGYVMAHGFAGQSCDATLEHEVSVFVAQATTPPATPTMLETIVVPSRPSGGKERHVLVGLTTPITLQAGDQLFVAMRNAGTYPNVPCWQLCKDPAHYAENQTWWSNAGAPPFPWATLASFDIDGTVNAFALGHP